MADELEPGDWLIQAIRHKDKAVRVYAPAQLLFVDNYVRDAQSGKERWEFHLEILRRGQTMKWKQFRSAAQSGLGPQLLPSPKTQAIRDVQTADRLLTLWTPGGLVSRR